MPAPIVNGIPILVVVFGLVEFLKKLEISGKVLTIASMIIGVLLGVLYQLSTMYVAVATWYGVALWGLLIGLSASGLYDFINSRVPTVSK